MAETTTTVKYKINKDTKDLTDAELQKILKESRGKLAKKMALREIERRKAAQKGKSSTNEDIAMDAFDKGGMPKKKGYAKGGKMNDMRKTGMFYGGMSRRGK